MESIAPLRPLETDRSAVCSRCPDYMPKPLGGRTRDATHVRESARLPYLTRPGFFTPSRCGWALALRGLIGSAPDGLPAGRVSRLRPRTDFARLRMVTNSEAGWMRLIHVNQRNQLADA